MKTQRPARTAAGFTLTETLVVVAVVLLLALFGFQLGARAVERSKHAVDVMKMRQINSAIIARAVENNGIAYTKQETGNSVYRQWDDPMSLCQVLADYLQGEQAWISPAANWRHKKFRNSYAWSQAPKISYNLDNPEKSFRYSQIDNPENVLTLWNNFGYTLPSGFNRPESNSTGPKQAPANFHHRPWNRKRDVNWFYLDGHVETR